MLGSCLPFSGRFSVNLSLYVVANAAAFPHQEALIFKVGEAVRGGATCVQLLYDGEDLEPLSRLAEGLKQKIGPVPLFLNGSRTVEIVRAIGAEGIYLEKEGEDYRSVRKQLGERAIIGMPVRNIRDLVMLEEEDAIDYISVKVFASKVTSPKNDILWGVEGLERIRKLSNHRIVTIGGMMRAEDPYTMAQKFQAAMKRGTG